MIRKKLHSPIIEQVKRFYDNLAPKQKTIKSGLFVPNESNNPKIFKPHLCKTVYLSVYIDAISRLKQKYDLNKSKTCALLVNVVASETPYFLGVHQKIFTDREYNTSIWR